MARQDDVAKVKALTGEADDALIELLLDEAEEDALSYTNRTRLPDALRRTVRQIAVIAYNRRGTEGESGRSEGGESYSFETLPESVYSVLNKFRLARIGGITHEAKTEQDTDVSPQEADDSQG
ncbi:MAG: phage head-tail connector protein [Blautia sp.]|nr:phage head-tail connector protein [Blautia sp.]